MWFFNGLNMRVRRSIAQHMKSAFHAANTWITKNGDIAKELYIVNTGRVELYLNTSDSRSVQKHLLDASAETVARWAMLHNFHTQQNNTAH